MSNNEVNFDIHYSTFVIHYFILLPGSFYLGSFYLGSFVLILIRE
jgi:hypothetical protein